MATKYTSHLQGLKSAEQFVDGFSGSSPEIQYIFIGNSLPAAEIPQIVESVSENNLVFDNIIAAKRVKASDVNLVIPRVNWETNKKYRQFDPDVSIEDSITGNTSQSLKPLYVFTSTRNVYKCLSNNESSNSTVEPSGDYTTSNGVIETGDGYIWKYMYNVRSGNKFINSTHLPVPTRNNESTETDTVFNLDPSGVRAGELTTIIMTNGGDNYRNFSNVSVLDFGVGNTTLTVSADFLSAIGNLSVSGIAAANMSVSGNGIASDTVVSSIDTINNKITIDKETISTGGDTSDITANNLTITTRVIVDGDGSGAIASATVNAVGGITNISVDTIGVNYEKANARIFGTGTNANTRVLLAPKFGHAFNLGKDLAANSVMVATKIGDIDSTENGLVPVGIDFRQIGLLRNPYKYGESSAVTDSTANDVVKQVYTVATTTGSSYQEDELVYQGSSATNFTVSGRVHRIVTATQIEVIDVHGEFTPAVELVGDTSGASRTVTSITTPEFEPHSADILYVENITPVTRVDGQSEDIRLVLQF